MRYTDQALLVIKKFTVRRGQGAEILDHLLNGTTGLRMDRFRAWNICANTVDALGYISEWSDQQRQDELDFVIKAPNYNSWICLFSHTNPHRSSHSKLLELCGDPDGSFSRDSLFYKLGIMSKNLNSQFAADVPFYIPPQDKIEIASMLLFT